MGSRNIYPYGMRVTNSWDLKTKNNCKGFNLKDNGCWN